MHTEESTSPREERGGLSWSTGMVTTTISTQGEPCERTDCQCTLWKSETSEVKSIWPMWSLVAASWTGYSRRSWDSDGSCWCSHAGSWQSGSGRREPLLNDVPGIHLGTSSLSGSGIFFFSSTGRVGVVRSCGCSSLLLLPRDRSCLPRSPQGWAGVPEGEPRN